MTARLRVVDTCAMVTPTAQAGEIREAVAIGDIRAAAVRIGDHVHHTPVLRSRAVDAMAGCDVFFKAEHLQRTGSFKIRGATNALLRLDAGRRHAGVVAFSSGNHAQAVASAAARAGVAATIVMPRDAPAVKLAAVLGYGAEVVPYDRFTEDREAIAAAISAETGRALIPPYDDPGVIAGQGTVGLELFGEVSGLDLLLVPGSGGGLSAGCAIAAAALSPQTDVVVVEPAAGDDITRSLAAGRRTRIAQPDTIADGLAGQIPGVLTFPLLQRLVSGAVTVADAEIVDAMALVFERMKQVVEPSGAAGLAAVLSGAVSVAGKRVGVVLSGGNIGSARFAELLTSARPGRP